MIVGVLAFQGDFAEHIQVLNSLHVPSVEVRSLKDLTKANALIIPGGESTVIAKFLAETGLGKEIKKRIFDVHHPLSVLGTCAGAIVLAKKATGKNAPATLGLIDITVDRNAYGTQRESFEASLKVTGLKGSLPVAFIRAPKIARVGKHTEVLAMHDAHPVLVREGNVMVATFHPEVRGASQLHALFLSQC